MDKLNPIEEYLDFKKFLQIVLILSHGNAAPERGFSVNKQIIVPNLREESLIAQRVIYDSIKLKGGIENLSFEKEFLIFIRKSYQRYEEALKKKKNEKNIDDEKEKEERLKALQVKELKQKEREIWDNFLNQKEEIERRLRQVSTAQKKK